MKRLLVTLVLAFPTLGFTGCQAEKEIEYPPEVIPDIPASDRSTDGPPPAE